MVQEENDKIDRVKIWMRLMNEGSYDMYRPIMAEIVGDGIYRVLPTEDYSPESEEWEFPPGTLVRCAEKTLLTQRHTEEVSLVPVKQVPESQ